GGAPPAHRVRRPPVMEDPGPELEPPLLDGPPSFESPPEQGWPRGTGMNDPHVRRRALWAMGIAGVLFVGGVIGLGLPAATSGGDNVHLALSDTTVVNTTPASGDRVGVKPVFTPIEFA